VPPDYGEAHGIAVTSAARAILDAGDYATVAEVEGLIADARVKKIVTIAQVEDVMNRAGRRKAAAVLRKALDDGPGITRSTAERVLRRILREAGIEQPITGYKIGVYEADFAWPKYMLIVEFDSWTWHSGKADFHHDRQRNAFLTAQGWSILPVTWRMLEERPYEVVRLIAAAIAVR
jgi:very-short-patch-repair endonuclease